MTVITPARYDKPSPFRLDRVHRLLIYGVATVWFMVFVLAHQRNYQDAWILADIVWPFAAWALLFLWIVAREPDNRVVALVVAATLFVAQAIPALKYKQPFGTALDSAIHYLVTKSLITTGHSIAPDEVYSSIPALHSWLAQMALAGGYAAEGALKFGLPLLASLMPLLVYWFTRVATVPTGPARYAIILTVTTSYSQFQPSGTGFTLVPLVFLLGVLLLREYYVRLTGGKVAFTLVLLLAVAQLTFWHSTTPLVLPAILLLGSLTPVLVRLVNRRAGSYRPAGAFLWMALLVAVAFLAYHVIAEDRIFEVVTRTAGRFVTLEAEAQRVVPQRLFEITLVDLLRVALLIQGNEGLIMALTGVGALVVWHYRTVWRTLLPFYTFWLLVAVTFLAMMALAVTGLDYARFLTVPMAVAPFAAGAGLWWLHQRLTRRSWATRLGQVVWIGVLAVLGIVWAMEFYGFQPLVPRARALDPNAPGEYVVWLNSVNTAYQQDMLTFAQQHAAADSRFALDVTGHRQFLRYFGYEQGYRRRLYLPLQLQQTVDPARVDFFLLHWPGAAGPFTEQVEWRSQTRIEQYRATRGWDLIYDNGQSFILKVR